MSGHPADITQKFAETGARISQYCTKYHRKADSVRLVAVSKRHSADRVLQVAQLGQRDFAENYVQEGTAKIAQVSEALATSDEGQRLIWHFIGHIQSRKCRQIAENFQWVHTIESFKVADKLNHHRDPSNPLNVLIQLNLQQEDSKSGITLDELSDLANHLVSLPSLVLRGLMIIPRVEPDFERQRHVFRRCREAQEKLNQEGYNLDQLSMGMTDDMEAAIAEGATQIRIGTAIFGPRPD